MAIKKMSESSANVVGFRVVGNVCKEDYETITPQIETLVDQNDSIRLLLDMEQFHWEEVNAWGADLRFRRSFHNKIEKMAIVGDRRWESWLEKVASPFFAKASRFFAPDDRDTAWAWLRA